MLNPIIFEYVKRNLISEKTQKRTNNPEDVLAIFLPILVLYANNVNQERNSFSKKYNNPLLRSFFFFRFFYITLSGPRRGRHYEKTFLKLVKH